MSHEPAQPRKEAQPQDGAPAEKLVHLALPVRLTHMAERLPRRPWRWPAPMTSIPVARRLLSFRDVKVGDLITVERGRNKSVCQVVWTARSQLRPARPVHRGVCRRRPNAMGRRVASDGRALLPSAGERAQKNKPAMNNFRRGDENRTAESALSGRGRSESGRARRRAPVDGRLEQTFTVRLPDQRQRPSRARHRPQNGFEYL